MSNTQPSLTFIRPVTNFDHVLLEEVRDEFSDIARRSALTDTGVRFNFPRNDAYRINLITGGELLGFHRDHGLSYGPDDVEALADHLERKLPESIDDHLAIDTFPLSIYGRASSRDFRAGAGNMLLEERELIWTAIHGYYGVESSVEEHLPESDRFVRLSIARINYKNASYTDKISSAFGTFLARATAILPEEIILDPIEIHDTESERSLPSTKTCNKVGE